MHKNTIKVMHDVFQGKYNLENPLATFKDSPCRNMFFTYNKQETIIQQYDPVKYIYFFLKGSAHVTKPIVWAKEEIIDTIAPLDILGIVELLNGYPTYTAFVTAETPCIVFRIPVKQFIEILKQDGVLCFETLRVLGSMTMHNMNLAESVAIYDSYDRLCHFLFLRAYEVIPYTYPHTRKKLADDLHINLRTLYRHIDTMKQEGYLKDVQGKIVIEEAQLKRLYEKYGTD